MHSPFNLHKPIAIGSDHAGYNYKEDLISFLEGKGIAFKDFGAHSIESVDYADFAHPVALAVEKEKLLLVFYFVAVPMEWQLPLINTKASGLLSVGAKNWQNLPGNIMMPILFAYRQDL